jgi:nucleoside-diphosphate-sugar epimerase
MPETSEIRKNPEIRKILIVGPNGNVGKALIPALLKLGYAVRALQYRSRVEPRPGVEVVEGNTMDVASLEKAVDGVDAVCHLIRATGAGKNAFEKWFNCAVAGAANLLEAARKVPLKRFIAGSADNVFGHVTIPHSGPIDENSPKRFADGYYGLFKIVEEEMCRQYRLGFGVPAVIARFGWIWTEEFVGFVGRDKETITKLMDRDGKPLVRHDVHIDDAVQGILLCLQNEKAIGEDFIFCAPAPYSSDDLCRVLLSKFDWPVVERKTDYYSWALSCAKARSLLGYRPQVNVLDWLRKKLSEK